MTDPSPSADGAAVSTSSWFGIELTHVYGDVLSGITRQTRCSQTALDVLHDALVRYAVAASLRPVSTPQAYLRRIVRNVLADRYRIENRYVPLAQDDPDEATGLRAAAGQVPVQPSAETVADMRQRLERLQSVIAALPPRCREVFWLLRVEGLTHEEIASRLNISLKTVESHVTRALVALVALRRTCDPSAP